MLALPDDRVNASERFIQRPVSADFTARSMTAWVRAPSWKVTAQGRCSRIAFTNSTAWS